MHAERFAPCRRPVKRFSNLRRSASGHELSRPISLFGLKSSAGGAPITARRAERRIKMAVAQLRLLRIARALLSQKTHLRVMKFPNSRTFFLLRADSLGLQKSGPSFGRKAGAQAAHRYGSAQHDG